MNYEKAKSQEPTVFLIRKLWRFAEGLRRYIVLYAVMLTLANLVVLAAPLIFGAFIGEIQAHGVSDQNLGYLSLLLSGLFVQTLVFWALHGPARVIERVVAFWAEINYRRYLLGGVLDLRLTWHSEHDSGDTIDKVNKAGDGLTEFGQNVFQIIQVVVKLTGTTIVLMWFSPWVGLSVFVFVLISFVAILQFDKRLLPQYRQLNIFSNKASAALFDALSNVTTVKILHIEKPVRDGVIGRFTDAHKLYKENAELNEWKWFVGNMFFQAISVVPMIGFLAFALSRNQTIDAGQISTLYLYLADLVFVWFGFGSYYEMMLLYKNRILNAFPIEQAFEAQQKVQRKMIDHFETLSISDLVFRYNSGQERMHLDGIAMSLKRGERIAVIGESGSGKSTFLKVFHGMYPHAKAKLGVDAAEGFQTSFADIDLKTMLVPQEPEIFSSTIGENITLGINYTDEALEKAAHIAAFDKVVALLPNGYKSVVNEKGVNLSGGQKQRLALARAILFSSDKDVILLDESTSSVDPENETEIYQRIFAEFHDKTIIASIHKMNLLKLFDRIVVFEDGKIADEGTFGQLMARNADFKASFEQFVSTH